MNFNIKLKSFFLASIAIAALTGSTATATETEYMPVTTDNYQTTPTLSLVLKFHQPHTLEHEHYLGEPGGYASTTSVTLPYQMKTGQNMDKNITKQKVVVFLHGASGLLTDYEVMYKKMPLLANTNYYFLETGRTPVGTSEHPGNKTTGQTHVNQFLPFYTDKEIKSLGHCDNVSKRDDTQPCNYEPEAIRNTARVVKEFLDRIVAEYNYKHHNIYLAGQSQGALTSLHVATMFSGLGGLALFSANALYETVHHPGTAQNTPLRSMQYQGSRDYVFPIAVYGDHTPHCCIHGETAFSNVRKVLSSTGGKKNVESIVLEKHQFIARARQHTTTITSKHFDASGFHALNAFVEGKSNWDELVKAIAYSPKNCLTKDNISGLCPYTEDYIGLNIQTKEERM